MADWKAFEIAIPGKDFLEPVRNILETLLVFLEVLKAILNTIKVFLTMFGNPIKALVEALIRLIEELFAALKASGVFAYFDLPDFREDPKLARLAGGIDEFEIRFKGSLFDVADYARPQPRASTQSAFLLMVVDSSDPRILIERIKALLKFLGKELTAPRWEAPQNVQALPVGDSGDPIVSLSGFFKDPPSAVQVKWTLPTSSTVPDPGFQDTVNSMLREFLPPSFLIERSEIPPTQVFDVSTGTGDTIDTGKMRSSSADDVGLVEYDAISTFSPAGLPTTTVKYKKRLLDENDEPVIKFNRYIDISGVNLTNILGQLGTFRYIDNDVEPGKTYYYRVRAYSGPLDYDSSAQMVRFGDTEFIRENQDGNPSGHIGFRWPSDGKRPVSMGAPSGLVVTAVPKLPSDTEFDVLDSLRKLFQVAFSLDFHQPPPENPADNPSEVGVGSLLGHAGPLGSFQAAPILGAVSTLGAVNASGNIASSESLTEDQRLAAQEAGVDIEGGQTVKLPWQRFGVRRQSARLTDIVCSAMLAQGGGPVSTYQNFMTGPFPSGTIDDYDNLEHFVQTMVTLDEDGNVSLESQDLYAFAYGAAVPRQNVLTVITFLKSYALSGVPPNWVSVNFLRDIVPWTTDIIDKILAKIQALLDAFQGVLDEINAFIELIERKIAALEEFIRFLIDILNFIESLQINASLLFVEGISGGPESWVEALDNAGGARPQSDPNALTAGVCFAFVAADIGKFVEAFKLIF